MHVNFLLGPAGSGKTFRCLREIAAELKSSPRGGPLIFLAPRQATFQLEYDLLSDPELPGYTRLKIVSFDTLAEMILDEYGSNARKLLSEEGRVMVIRALLARHHADLKLFGSTARLPGFARQLSSVFDELQQHQVSPARLRELAGQDFSVPQLSAKLHDLALLLQAYQAWLQETGLLDGNALLNCALVHLREAVRDGKFYVDGLWLDGFAKLSPQELDLLCGLLPPCRQATLAFCLDAIPACSTEWFSMWSTLSQTFCRCKQQIEAVPGVKVTTELLQRRSNKSRFEGNPVLTHLERHWVEPRPFGIEDGGDAKHAQTQARPLASSITIYNCPNPELEAVTAAREIRRHVQEGGRYRDTAVLVRSLEGYHHLLRRAFTRYEIPFFLDRRESISHHPLAELTRYALRLVNYGWEHDDWFGALKTGLVHPDTLLIDLLENEALAHGWRGSSTWQNPLKLDEKPDVAKTLERLRQEIVPVFQHFAARLQLPGRCPAGTQMAEAIRELWDGLSVGKQLEAWSQGQESSGQQLLQSEIHSTAADVLERWLEDLQLAFGNTAMPLSEWLPVVDAGLSSLTVGIVPPGLDQVLIGAIDRSRNPDLQLVILLGMNEMVFPSVPPAPILLGEYDRVALSSVGLDLGLDQRQQIGFERFLGYIACTRARRRVVLAYSQRGLDDKALNPSPFINHLQRLFPDLPVEEVPLERSWEEAVHASELLVPMLRQQQSTDKTLLRLSHMPVFAPVLAHWDQVIRTRTVKYLSPGLPEKLYGLDLTTSISDLEEYAACPFKFFLRRGLKAQEREEFETDPRERGSFQHDVLMGFHRALQSRNCQWREISPAEARVLIGKIGGELQKTFRNGLFDSTAERRFTAGVLIQALQDCIEVLVGWARQYQFDPRAVEISFGGKEGGLQAWKLELGEGHTLSLRGRIDRVDLHPLPNHKAAVVVMDYKSGGQKLDETRLQNGLDLQLLAYLGVLQQNPGAPDIFGTQNLVPAGAFYVGLRPSGKSQPNRREVLDNAADARRSSYQHSGRFDAEYIALFDNRGESKGDQFRYAFNASGALSRRGNDALADGQFGRWVDEIRRCLVRYGQEIYAGNISVSPYRLKQEIACDRCDYRPVCRFDPWLAAFRVLKRKAETLT